MPDRILVINPGSSSLKLSIVDASGAAEAAETIDAPGDIAAAVRSYRDAHGAVDAIAVRVVHGGPDFTHSVVMTPETLAALRPLSDLAPLHNPAALSVLDAVCGGDTPVVACFDTAFHATLPAAAATYALPAEWREKWPIRRYGFHGLNHAYTSRRAAELLNREHDAGLRVVTCHLGSGASLAAVLGGVSVDTTMGFTPLDGLVMATRSGSVDPGLVLWLAKQDGMTVAEIERSLESESGLKGLAGTADIRDVLRRATSGDNDALLARDVYVHRLVSLIGAMVASLSGVDALVFTGGVGEGSAEIRMLACARLSFLGVTIDAAQNEAWRGHDGAIATPDAAVRTLVIAAREDLEIAREVRRVLD